ncbi:hypothetical protein Ae168Ps1_4788 [Pseudonocardia sp. Ae168_Ps1]|nr:hypothetical protein Ae150APs1_4750 [Pseudonocardia sp. Ae150A_Ps1]OLL82382.1 hypothetical protein Ae168Ps1_4788 [Pseudonocardia sp. Ae168_Ps1]OLL83503.1 hypothetical protein Ae263Ps1_0558c [Pseudonocardia sp. Ae263_Ps1]OLL90458.1 hypothetical protein Ae356Ps1_0355 [Pseudonocardia sp. Ae356_Ps1]
MVGPLPVIGLRSVLWSAVAREGRGSWSPWSRAARRERRIAGGRRGAVGPGEGRAGDGAVDDRG